MLIFAATAVATFLVTCREVSIFATVIAVEVLSTVPSMDKVIVGGLVEDPFRLRQGNVAKHVGELAAVIRQRSDHAVTRQ